MGHGLVIIKKALDGEEFSNTYGFWNEDGTVQLGENDLVAVGANTPILDNNTDLSVDAPGFLHKLVAFDRAITHTSVQYVELYVTDGTRNETDTTNVFFTTALDFVGRWVNAVPVPGNITLLIQRVPSGFSNRKGRLYMRAALSETEVKLGGDRLLTWESAAARTAASTRVANAMTNSELALHTTGGGFGDSPLLSIPHFSESVDAEGKTIRNLIGSTPIANLVVSRPNGRQVQKGRKKKASA